MITLFILSALTAASAAIAAILAAQIKPNVPASDNTGFINNGIDRSWVSRPDSDWYCLYRVVDNQ